MRLSLNNIGKRYNYEWIFRNVNIRLEAGKRYAVTGPNGSGKSTLLQIIAGSLSHSEGTIEYRLKGKAAEKEDFYQYISLAAPYLELIEELNLEELFRFQRKFKPFVRDYSFKEMAGKVHLKEARFKPIKYYSSGMKQRAKLAQAFFADVPVLLLDEPCTNLDEEGIEIYKSLLSQNAAERLVIISSNNKMEYEGSNEIIKITDYK